MALYAFDGTWNQPDTDGDPVDTNTNVFRFLSYYGDDDETLGNIETFRESYVTGPGTKGGRIGKVVGGFTGVGSRDRVEDCLEAFAENWKRNQEEDRIVDVIGFSRGAAIALHFCNQLAKGVRIDGEKIIPEVRFLGLWDTVSAFGLPGIVSKRAQKTDIGWDLDVSSNVKACYHAMALDEHRQAFDVHRLDPENDDAPQITELWFRGVHSDIGGGNGNTARNNIALHWMLEKAIASGLPIDDEAVQRLAAEREPGAAVSFNKTPGGKIDREIFPRDQFHPTAGRVLRLGESAKINVDSRLRYDWSGVILVKGGRYTFEPDPDGKWKDATIECTSAGWPEDLNHNATFFGWWKEKFLESDLVSMTRRIREAEWFEMVATVECSDKNAVPIGMGQHAKPEDAWESHRMGPLFLFANDARMRWLDKYKNNSGAIDVKVTRVG